ncbi:hypothetical protein EVJ33_04960 [Exiguobacterium sp. SL-10]|uniref:Imm64 family immunity protein n=1 Tax=unclassified Exiguobacterium TaxID=2644629 RepID=UPI00103ED251|nr:MULTISPECIES: Imm64 family immunity protein [unclassified Exiguobacterium]TCI22937.1 hypothetical protein EVJ34_00535 [Exiguobacterium sp. SL-9]TCI30651.1 hypothetical protein EVJ33_04960 [Exiguobacterium sp. SL-10]
MGKSGGFVSIGIAFTTGSGLLRNLQVVCEALMRDGGKIDRITYSKDEDGTEWVTIEPKGSDLDLSQIQYYGSITLSTARFGRRDQIVTVSLKTEVDFEGLLIDLDWEDLFVDTNETESIVRATDSVERLLIDVYRSTSFAYAVAGHEIELDWAPETLLQDRKVIESLSLSVIPVKDGLKVVHGSIALDGMTPQDDKSSNRR